MKSYIPWVICVLLAFLSGYLLFLLFSAGVSLDHARSEAQVRGESRELIIDVLGKALIDKPETELIEIIGALDSNRHIVKERDFGFIVDDLLIDVENGMVRDARLDQ